METNPPESRRLHLKEPLRRPDEKPPVMSDPRYCFFDGTADAAAEEEEARLRRHGYYRQGFTGRAFHEMLARLGLRVGLVFAGIYGGALLGAVIPAVFGGGGGWGGLFDLKFLLIYPFIACLRPLIFLVTVICAAWIYVNDNEEFEWADYRLPLTLLVLTHAFALGTMM
jgi:hypothetical protein